MEAISTAEAAEKFNELYRLITDKLGQDAVDKSGPIAALRISLDLLETYGDAMAGARPGVTALDAIREYRNIEAAMVRHHGTGPVDEMGTDALVFSMISDFERQARLLARDGVAVDEEQDYEIIDGPKISSVVVYVNKDGEEMAAIVTRLCTHNVIPAMVYLQVFPFDGPPKQFAAICYSGEGEPNSWHWPE